MDFDDKGVSGYSGYHPRSIQVFSGYVVNTKNFFGAGAGYSTTPGRSSYSGLGPGTTFFTGFTVFR